MIESKLVNEVVRNVIAEHITICKKGTINNGIMRIINSELEYQLDFVDGYGVSKITGLMLLLQCDQCWTVVIKEIANE